MKNYKQLRKEVNAKSILTPMQKLVLEARDEFVIEHNRSPKLWELKELFGYSGISSIQKHMDILKEKGCIK